MITFSLKDPQHGIPPKEQKPTPIILTYHFAGRRLKLGIGESIEPENWNPTKHRPRASYRFVDGLNKYLDKLEIRVKNLHLELKAEHEEVTPAMLHQALKHKRTDGRRETLMTFFSNFVEDRKRNAKPGTAQVYHSCYRLLKMFPGAKDFSDINAQWFQRFQAWMENYRDKKITDGYATNYIAKCIAIIREVMTLASRAGLHRNTSYRNGDYKRQHEDAEAIYLTQDELLSLHGVQLPPGMDRVRDRFLISAFTGLRFSDSSKINLDNVRDGLMYDKNKKTKTNVVIPLHWVVEEIMRKYPGGLPPAISNQKTNETLKRIGELAGIKTPVVKHITKGGTLKSITLPKHQFITTHTGRRSAATNMILAGVPQQAVMMITGHKTTTAFQKYIRCSQEESARAIAQHPYFVRPQKSAI